jgi:hypothetical protein
MTIREATSNIGRPEILSLTARRRKSIRAGVVAATRSGVRERSCPASKIPPRGGTTGPQLRPRCHRAALAGLLCAGALALQLGGCPAAGPDDAGGGAPGALTGVWRSGFSDPFFGGASIELILQNNGSFQQQTLYAAGSLVTIFGTFRVFPDQALLRLDIERGEPTQSCGPLGCTPILYPAGESYGYSLNSDGTLTLLNLNCAPGQGGACALVYGRAN